MIDSTPGSRTAEDAVRSYLLWLEDPGQLRDQEAIDVATAAAGAASDPIERLRALAQLEALQSVDGESYRAGFVQHANQWAETAGVSEAAFRTIGVSAQDLRDAGISATKAPGTSRRRTRVSPDAVRAALPDGSFRIAEIEERSGASTATVRKVITEMISEGSVVDLGPDQEHAGRGRAPLLYRKR